MTDDQILMPDGYDSDYEEIEDNEHQSQGKRRLSSFFLRPCYYGTSQEIGGSLYGKGKSRAHAG